MASPFRVGGEPSWSWYCPGCGRPVLTAVHLNSGSRKVLCARCEAGRHVSPSVADAGSHDPVIAVVDDPEGSLYVLSCWCMERPQAAHWPHPLFDLSCGPPRFIGSTWAARWARWPVDNPPELVDNSVDS